LSLSRFLLSPIPLLCYLFPPLHVSAACHSPICRLPWTKQVIFAKISWSCPAFFLLYRLPWELIYIPLVLDLLHTFSCHASPPSRIFWIVSFPLFLCFFPLLPSFSLFRSLSCPKSFFPSVDVFLALVIFIFFDFRTFGFSLPSFPTSFHSVAGSPRNPSFPYSLFLLFFLSFILGIFFCFAALAYLFFSAL